MAVSKLLVLLVVCAVSTKILSAFTLPPGQVSISGSPISTTASPSSWRLAPRVRSTATQLWTSPKALANEGDWTAYLDEDSTGLVYYFNGRTGESLWEPPTSTFPIVNLPEDMRRKAEVKRLAYIRKVQKQEKENEGEESKLADKVSTREEKSSGENWFDFLFEDEPDKTEEKDDAAEKYEATEAEEQPNFFGNLFKQLTDVENGEASQDVATATAVADEKKEEKKIEVTEPEITPIKLDMATCVLPHPAKVFWGGEDAVFTAGRTFGVFDGVSGARKLDGIPLYSKTLATEMKKRCGKDKGLSVQDMQKSLQEAREIADENSTGASTALVASITEDGFLRALNVGDSTCIVIRDGRIVSRTKEISHFFECPYQLSTDSPDKPRDGTKLNLELVRGDLIVMGSDGVFDNLTDTEILDSIAQSNTARLGQVAKKLADRSRKVSLNKKAETPYAKLAKKNGDPDYGDGLGGKVDDISCVVVRYE